MGRIMRDMKLKVAIGPDWTGGDIPTIPATANIMGRAREIDIDDSLEATNVAGAGFGRVANRYHSGKGKITISSFVTGNGYLAKAVGAVSPIGKWIKIETAPDSQMVGVDVWVGVITNWNMSTSRDEAQVEKIEIDLDPDVDPVDE